MTRFLTYALCILTTVDASFTNCASYSRALPVHELFADPPGIVAINQPLTFRIQFTVPNGTWVPYGQVEVKKTWNAVPMPVDRFDLSTYLQTPLYPDLYTFEDKDQHVFPTGIWGRITTEINVYNASGAQLLCARWIVFATGTDKNETQWPYSAMFT